MFIHGYEMKITDIFMNFFMKRVPKVVYLQATLLNVCCFKELHLSLQSNVIRVVQHPFK
jgi:hypothetical protein